jgi:hypothetical protein
MSNGSLAWALPVAVILVAATAAGVRFGEGRGLRARLESGAPPGGPGDPFLTESRMRVP